MVLEVPVARKVAVETHVTPVKRLVSKRTTEVRGQVPQVVANLIVRGSQDVRLRPSVDVGFNFLTQNYYTQN